MAGEKRPETGEITTIPAGLASEEDHQQQRIILRELADIETKVIWELENWKRAEEARFRFNLKQKESEFIEKLRAEWKQKEIDREKVAQNNPRYSKKQRIGCWAICRKCNRK